MRISFEFLSALQQVSSSRSHFSITTHESGVQQYRGGAGTIYYLVTNQSISRKILLSDCFESYDYFSTGLKRTFAEQEFSFLQDFFEHSPIFHEGDAHKKERRDSFKLLREVNQSLLEKSESLSVFLRKRKSRIRNANEFARLVTVFCLAQIIFELIGTPWHRSVKALLLRANIWMPYYIPQRHRRLEMALVALRSPRISELESGHKRLRLLLAQSLIVMGFDPLLASLTSPIVTGGGPPIFARDVYRNCPTTYVSRVCKRNINIDGIEFVEGSELSLFLLPAGRVKEICPIREHEGSSKSLAFGAGKHMCLGKETSLLILQMAEKCWLEIGGDLSLNDMRVTPDGAFLAYT